MDIENEDEKEHTFSGEEKMHKNVQKRTKKRALCKFTLNGTKIANSHIVTYQVTRAWWNKIETLLITFFVAKLSSASDLYEKMNMNRVVINNDWITFYSPSCLSQETAKEPFGLRVKLLPSTCLTHMMEALHCPFNCWKSSREAVNSNLYRLLFEPTWVYRIEHGSTASVTDAPSTRPRMNNVEPWTVSKKNNAGLKTHAKDNLDILQHRYQLPTLQYNVENINWMFIACGKSIISTGILNK